MKVYLIEYCQYECVDEYLTGCNSYIVNREIYTNKKTAEKRVEDLKFKYSHEINNDNEVFKIDLYTQEDCKGLYDFIISEVDLKDITPEQLPEIKIEKE